MAAGLAAKRGVPLALVSPAGAAAVLGPQVFQAMIEETRRRHPDADIEGVLDCGDDAGHALAAFRAGVDAVRVDLADEPRGRIADIAGQMGRRLDISEAVPLDDWIKEPTP